MIHKQPWLVLVSIEFHTHLSLVCKASMESTTSVPSNNGDDLTWDFSWRSIGFCKIKILERWKCEISQTNSHGMFEHMCLIFKKIFIDEFVEIWCIRVYAFYHYWVAEREEGILMSFIYIWQLSPSWSLRPIHHMMPKIHWRSNYVGMIKTLQFA